MSFETIQNNLKNILIDIVNQFLITNENKLDIYSHTEMTELLNAYLSELSIKQNTPNIKNIIPENQKNQYIYINREKAKTQPIDKKSCLNIIQETLRKLNIVKPNYILNKKDLLDIIKSIDDKLIKESIILYMGYYLNNKSTCDTEEQADKILNDIIISKFYTNDIHFFESILINEIHISNNLFYNTLKSSNIISKITMILKDLHMMLRELVNVSLKIDTKVYINAKDVLSDEIVKNSMLEDDATTHKIYKIKTISLEELLPYCDKYDSANSNCIILAQDELDKIFKYENAPSCSPAHSYENNDLCSNDNYIKLIKKRNKNNVLSGGLNGDKDITQSENRETIIQNNDIKNIMYNLYRDDECKLSDNVSLESINHEDEKLNDLWFYQSNLTPVDIPTEMNCNNIHRKTFSFNKLDVEFNKLKKQDTQKHLSLSTCISLLWYYKLYEEYNNIDNKHTNRNYNNSRIHDFFTLCQPTYYLQFFKDYIIEQTKNKFDEETLAFFIILGALMYITSFAIDKELLSSIHQIKSFYLFDNGDTDFKLNSKIRNEIYKATDRNYISMLENIIPTIINSVQLDNKIRNKDIHLTRINYQIDFSLLFFIESSIAQNLLNIYFNIEYLSPVSRKDYIEYITRLEEKKILINYKLTHVQDLYQKKKLQMNHQNIELAILLAKNQMILLDYDDGEHNDYTDQTEYDDINMLDDSLLDNFDMDDAISIEKLTEIQKQINYDRLHFITKQIDDFVLY